MALFCFVHQGGIDEEEFGFICKKPTTNSDRHNKDSWKKTPSVAICDRCVLRYHVYTMITDEPTEFFYIGATGSLHPSYGQVDSTTVKIDGVLVYLDPKKITDVIPTLIDQMTKQEKIIKLEETEE